MAIDRRTLLHGAAASLAMPLFPGTPAARSRELYAAALREAGGGYAAAIFSPVEGMVAKVGLPARGHSCAIRPGTAQCIAFARRPGNFAVAFSRDGNAPPLWFAARQGRHFYGHGVFSPDGRLLYSTENDFDGQRGVVGVRDATGAYRQIGEFPSGGTGPHDMAMMRDGRTLVVANGGIETHPDFGREPLNLDTMSPNLTYIDALHGDILETHILPRSLHQLSIRHLCVAAGDTVVFGCQHKGPRNETPMLLGVQRRGAEAELVDLPDVANARLKGYVGSICADSSGAIVAATSPPGGVALYFDVSARRLLGHASLADASGVSGRPGKPGFLLTSGTGKLALGLSEGLRIVGEDGTAWDNHVVRF